MNQTCISRWVTMVALVISMSLCWSYSHADTIRDGRAAMGPVTSIPMVASAPTVMDTAARKEPSAVLPVENVVVLRTLPTVSKPLSVGGTTLMPYIGAGFGGGYATELDRSLNSTSSILSNPSNSGLKSLSQSFFPNEVQMGIRFPF